MLAKSQERSGKGFKERLDLIKRVRTEICKSFQKDQKAGRISLRVTDQSDYFVKLKQGRSLILSTNYDTLLHERYFKTRLSDIVSLHGNTNWPTGIYLPTETSIEPYYGCLNRGAAYLKQSHRIAIEAFENANRIVVWGNSLDYYDSELCMVLTEGYLANKKSPEIFVVDPHMIPVNRLKALINQITINYINPNTGTCQVI